MGKVIKSEKKIKKPKNRREKEKYPALKKKFNTKIRQDFIESEEYINGVCNDKGEMVMRALTEDELEFLNRFNAETVVTSFKKDGKDFYFYDDEKRKELYRENNRRNYDLFSAMKVEGRLLHFDLDSFDNLTSRKLDHIDPEAIVLHELDILEKENKLNKKAEKPKKRRTKVIRRRAKSKNKN